MTKQLERELDDVLERRTPAPNEEVEALFQVASRFADQTPALTDAPTGPRALFIQGVETRRRTGWLQFLGPATLTAAVVVIVLLLGRTAVPGEAFYPVREALRSIGLAPASMEDVDELLAAAQVQLANAEEINDFSQLKARRHALNSVRLLGAAEQLLKEIEDEGQAESRYAALTSLLEKARSILLEDDDLTDENAARRDDEDDVFESGEDDKADENDADADDAEEGPGGNEGPTNEGNENEGPGENTGEGRAGSGDQGGGGEDETGDDNNIEGEGTNDGDREGNEGPGGGGESSGEDGEG